MSTERKSLIDQQISDFLQRKWERDPGWYSRHGERRREWDSGRMQACKEQSVVDAWIAYVVERRERLSGKAAEKAMLEHELLMATRPGWSPG